MNGEEIIGTVTRDGASIVIDRPLKIIAQPTPQGMQIGLIAWINSVLPGAAVSYAIAPEHVIVIGECDDELAKSYKQQVSGIALG